MQIMKINGRSIAYQRTGPKNRPLLVLLHHGLGAIRSWKKQIEAFNQAGYQVLTYDRWGHGDSAERDHWSMPNFEPDLADLQRILTQLDCTQVTLIGHSDGGNIAMHYAIQHPQQVASLVLIAAHIFIEPKMTNGIQALKHAFEDDPGFQTRLRRVHGSKSEAVFWGWIHGWTRPGLRDWDMRPLLNQISCPTLVVQGTHDEHASEQHARDLARGIPNAQLWLLPGAGHMLPQDHPVEFNPRVLKFLQHVLTEAVPE
jgi:pimeloyl-ACP methyl ester carboxylesterase